MKAVYDAPIRAGAAVVERVLASGVPALVVFETPNCRPCEALRPVLDDLAGEFKNRVLVLRVMDAASLVPFWPRESVLTWLSTARPVGGADAMPATRGRATQSSATRGPTSTLPCSHPP